MSNSDNFDIWMFVAGLGIFLFGMYHLEKGILGLSGKSFKKFLKTFTGTPLKGVLTGTFVTGVLQSSSLVTILTAAFLGSGLITLKNAIGVVFGSNIGTTMTAWIVAYLGFKMDISDLGFPFLAVGAFTYLFMDTRPFFKSTGSLFMGFGLLFLGIDFMKEAVEAVATKINFHEFSPYGPWIFIFLGIVITALIQSSSAMMVIVLSALFGQIIDINQACLLSVGANIGTTISLVLASLKGTADKKRLALSHVLFNGISGLIILMFLNQTIYFINNVMGIKTPVLVLAAFNTLLNVVGVLLIFPFITFISEKLQKLFITDKNQQYGKYIYKVSTDVTDVALGALDLEIKHIFYMTKEFFFKVMRFSGYNHEDEPILNKLFLKNDELVEQYNVLKKTVDEVTKFYKLLQTKYLSEAESNELAAHMIRVRSLVYAAKNMKDIVANVKEMDESDDVLSGKILKKLREFSEKKMAELSSHISMENRPDLKSKWHSEFDLFYHKTIDYLYDHLSQNEPPIVSVSTMSNVIKKMISCLEEMANAATDTDNIEEKITDIYT